MEKKNSPIKESVLLAIALDRTDKQALTVQLFEQLREAILQQQLAAGMRLPASRVLAQELGISRSTVTVAYEQLIAEGYIESRRGSGMYVLDLPDLQLQTDSTLTSVAGTSTPQPMASTLRFVGGAADMRLFPYNAWGKVMAQVWRRGDPQLFAPTGPAGDTPLRDAICQHLAAWRSLQRRADQLVMTHGATAGLIAALTLLTKPGDSIALEDPGYPVFQTLAKRAGLNVISIPVDEHGIQVDKIPDHAQIVIITPSHHYPLGGPLSLQRRHQLLQWAEKRQRYIFEDDYDSEFRYEGRPIPALASLDHGQDRVLYFGSFAKIFSDSLRLGFTLVPQSICADFIETLVATNGIASPIPQRPLAVFMQQGEFARHIRRMRRIYRERKAYASQYFTKKLAPYFTLAQHNAGMTQAVFFTPRLAKIIDDETLANQLLEQGVATRPLSHYYWQQPPKQGLLLGITARDDAELHGDMTTIKAHIDQLITQTIR